MPSIYARIILYTALVLAIFGGGVALEHRLAKVRLQAVELKYARAEQKAQAEADKKTQELAAQAALAAKNYENEHQSLIDYVSANPVGVVRLCNPSASSKPMPQTSDGKPRTNSTTPSPGTVLPMPQTDNQLRTDPSPDIGNLLELLAERADEVTSKAKELKEIRP